MGSAGRPHRRARSAKVLYKDSASEREDDESFSVAQQPILPSDRVRKNLALKRVSRSQERAEALQIQKAIEESLSQDREDVHGGGLAPDAANGASEIVDSEDEAPDVSCCMALEAGANPPQEVSISPSHEKALEKEAIFDEIQIPSSEIVNTESSVNPKESKSTWPLNADKKALKGAVEKDKDWSSEEEDDGDDEEDFTDDESSDASDDSKYNKKKRQLICQQKGRKAVGQTAKEPKAFSAKVKKPRSSRTLPEARASVPAKKASGNAMKPSKPANAKEKSLVINTVEESKKHLINVKESKENGRRGTSLKDSKTTLVEHRRSPSATLFNKASQPENASCDSSGILGFPAQSPTGLHRRVIGLSRRFKPPPLHPYLPKLED